MKKLLLLLIIPFLSFGQSWEQTFGNGEDDIKAYSVQQTSDGGYIITGGGGPYLYLLKIDLNGQEEWSQLLDGWYGRDIDQTSDGGYILVDLEARLIKTDEFGQEQWRQDTNLDGAGDNELFSVNQTNDGGYILGGSGYDTGISYAKPNFQIS